MPKVYFSRASANAALSEMLASAISGSIIQNSARWRLVFEFSAVEGLDTRDNAPAPSASEAVMN